LAASARARDRARTRDLRRDRPDFSLQNQRLARLSRSYTGPKRPKVFHNKADRRSHSLLNALVKLEAVSFLHTGGILPGFIPTRVDARRCWRDKEIAPQGSLIRSMESLVMEKLIVSWWGITLSADGTLAIGAAALIVLILAVAGRWR
jgi:hypothetical protein